MLRASTLKTHPVDRHFLLMGIVEQTYRKRSDPAMAENCAHFAETHISELPLLAPALKDEMDGILPRISTFQNYATLLTEQGKFDRASEVCQTALAYDLHDGTKSGFQGRIERIKKLKAKAHGSRTRHTSRLGRYASSPCQFSLCPSRSASART